MGTVTERGRTGRGVRKRRWEILGSRGSQGILDASSTALSLQPSLCEHPCQSWAPKESSGDKGPAASLSALSEHGHQALLRASSRVQSLYACASKE